MEDKCWCIWPLLGKYTPNLGSHIQVLTSRKCLEWDWVSCIGSILIEDRHGHLVLHSRDSVHHLLSCIALQLVLLGYCPIGEQYCEHQGLSSLVCMLMGQRPCDLHLGACSVWHSHIGWNSRRDCVLCWWVGKNRKRVRERGKGEQGVQEKEKGKREGGEWGANMNLYWYTICYSTLSNILFVELQGK